NASKTRQKSVDSMAGPGIFQASGASSSHSDWQTTLEGGGYASEAQYAARYTQEIPRPLGIGGGCSGSAARRDRVVGRRKKGGTARPPDRQHGGAGVSHEYYQRYVFFRYQLRGSVDRD